MGVREDAERGDRRVDVEAGGDDESCDGGVEHGRE